MLRIRSFAAFFMVGIIALRIFHCKNFFAKIFGFFCVKGRANSPKTAGARAVTVFFFSVQEGSLRAENGLWKEMLSKEQKPDEKLFSLGRRKRGLS